MDSTLFQEGLLCEGTPPPHRMLRQFHQLKAKQELTDRHAVGREQEAKMEMQKFHFGITPLDIKRQTKVYYQRTTVKEGGDDAHMDDM